MFLLATLLWLLDLVPKTAFAGFIYPDRSNPIQPYRNNLASVGYYDFYFRLETRISEEPKIVITFPAQTYPSVLKSGATCKIQISQASDSYEMACVKTTSKISITIDQSLLPELESGSTKVRVFSIQNPASGPNTGTGNFKIESFSKNGILVDINENFGAIGIAAAPVIYVQPSPTLPNPKADMSNDGSVMGGFLTNYVLSFTTTKYLVKDSWMRFEFPSDFLSFGDTTCSLVAQSFELGCKIVDGLILMIAPIPGDISPGLQRLKIRNIYNPYIKGRTSIFIFETLIPGTNTVIEYYEIYGVEIQPGQIKNPTVTAYPYNRNLYIDYKITFEPTNVISQGGYIEIIFPPTFQTLSPTCRVIRGLIQIDSATPFSCTSLGKSVKVENFATFSPQLVEINIFATNPDITGITDHFQITSYKNVNGNYYIIDENLLCGQITISSIDKPYFLKVDLFKKYTNISLGGTGPIDFRLYPSPPNVLPITSGAKAGEIYFMLPLWWRNNGVFIGVYTSGINPLCMFGATPSASCGYGGADGIQIYRIRTPTTSDPPNRYTTAVLADPAGLGECDLPISVQNAIITPIPGRFDFRVLTFRDATYSTFTTQPLDQDLFTMDIPVDPFPGSPLVYVTSVEESDPDNIVRVEFQVGLPVPWEGAINLNFTTVNNLYENSAAWPYDLGFTLTYPQYKRIPCRIKIGGSVVGFTGSPHPLAKCFVFAGSATARALLQVRGFSTTIGTNTNIEVDIPNVQLCPQRRMYCFIELTTAYTTAIEKPYTLNYFKQSVAYIDGPTARAHRTVVTGFSASFTPKEICLLTTWTFTFDLVAEIAINDHVVIKMQSKPFTFRYDSATSNLGRVDIIYHDMGTEYELYYLIKATKILPLGASRTFTLSGIRNSNFISPDDPASSLAYPLNHFPVNAPIGIITKMHYWAKGHFIEDWSFPRSNAWDDGGITATVINFLPQTPLRALDYDSWIIHKVDFLICNYIPVGGAITLEFPSNWNTFYADLTPTCNVWQGVKGFIQKLDSSLKCEWVGANNFYRISDFQMVPQFTTISLIYRIKSRLVSTTPTNLAIRTWFNKNNPYTPGSGVKNENDYYTTLLPPPITGPKMFPYKLEFGPFYQTPRRARVGDRGPFFITIITNYDLPSSGTINVYIPNAVGAIPTNGVLDCRVDGNLAKSCSTASSTLSGITMLEFIIGMPSGKTITHGVAALIVLDTRGADMSATLLEGIEWTKAGLFQFRVEVSGGAQFEFSNKVFEVFPTAWLNFWAWGASKMRSQTTGQSDPSRDCSYDLSIEKQCGLNFYRIFFQTINLIDGYFKDTKFYVEFSRTNLPTFHNGFQRDLGTGLNHRDLIPCYVEGFTLDAVNYQEIDCKLLLGTWPNPVRFEIQNYDDIPKSSDIVINVPKIFNPNKTFELMNVRVRAQQTVEILPSTTPKTYEVVQLYENNYDLPNVAWEYLAADSADIITRGTITKAPTFDKTTIDTAASLTISYKSTRNLKAKVPVVDTVAFQFPSDWQTVEACTCVFASALPKCTSIQQSFWVVIYINKDLAQTTEEEGTIDMKTPPFTYINPAVASPIKAYVFHRFRLVDILTFPVFVQALTPLTVTLTITVATTAIKNQISEYTIQGTAPKDVPGNGAIRITVPTTYGRLDSTCKNDIVGGSKLDSVGFACNRVGTSEVFVITLGGIALKANDKFQVTTRLLNPTAAGAFLAETFFENESPLNKLIAISANTNGPAITTTVPTPPVYWDDQNLVRKLLFTNDIGPITFKIKLNADIPKGTGTPPAQISTSTNYLWVQLPSQLQAPVIGGQVQVYWNNDPSYYQVYDSTAKTVKIYAPRDIDIKAGTIYTITITTINAYKGVNGFKFPSAQATQQVLVKVKDGTDTIIEEGFFDLFFPGKNFQMFSSCNMIRNAGYKTIVTVSFKPTTVIPSTGYLKVYFPTFNNEYNVVFDNDLGTGLNSGDSVRCDIENGFAAGTSLTCLIYPGNQVNGVAAYIKVSGWTASLATTTLYSFKIQQIVNPTVGDAKNTWIILESYSSTNTLYDTGISYDFTVVNVVPTTATLPAPTSFKTNLFDTGSDFALKISTPTVLSKDLKHDYFVIEFPEPYFPKQIDPSSAGGLICQLSTTVTCTYAYVYNWVIYKPTSADIATSQTSFTLKNINQAQYHPPAGAIALKGYAIKNRIIRTIYTYGNFGPLTVTGVDLGLAVSPYVVPLARNTISARILYSVSFTLPAAKSIPAGSVIDIIFPANYVLEQTCENDPTTDLTIQSTGDLICVSGEVTQAYSVKGFSYIKSPDVAPFKVVKFLMWATNPSAQVNNPSFSIKVYTDAATRTSILYDNTKTQATANVANLATVSDFSFADNSLRTTPNAVTAGSYAPFVFSIYIGTKIPTTVDGYLQVSFPSASGIIIPSPTASSYLLCTFEIPGTATVYGASACTHSDPASSGYSANIKIKIPHLPTLSGNTRYLVTITTSCGTNTIPGLYYPNSGNYDVTFDVSTTGSSIDETTTGPFRVLANSASYDFTSLKVIWAWQNKGLSTPVIIKLIPRTSVSSGGRLVVTFPVLSQDQTYVLFSSNLGVNSAYSNNGGAYDCYSATIPTTSSGIVCNIYYGKVENMIVVEVSNIQYMNSGSNYDVVLKDVKNPDFTSDDISIDIKVHTENSGGTVLDERVVYNVAAPQNYPSSTASTVTATVTPSNTVQTTGISIQFSSISVTANKLMKNRGRVVFEFPTSYSFSSVSGSGATGVYDVYNHIVIYTPSVNIASSTLSITLGSLNAPAGVETSAINIYIIYDRVYEMKFTSTPTFAKETTGFSFSYQVSSTRASVPTDYILSFTINKYIPTYGSITVEFPPGVNWNIREADIFFSDTSSLKAELYQINQNSFYFKVLQPISINQGFKVKVALLNPSSTGTPNNFYIKAYADSPPTKDITWSEVNSITIGSNNGYSMGSCTSTIRSNNNLEITHTGGSSFNGYYVTVEVVESLSRQGYIYLNNNNLPITINGVGTNYNYISSYYYDSGHTSTTNVILVPLNLDSYARTTSVHFTLSSTSGYSIQCYLQDLRAGGSNSGVMTVSMKSLNVNNLNFISVYLSLPTTVYSSYGFLVVRFSGDSNWPADLGFTRGDETTIPCSLGETYVQCRVYYRSSTRVRPQPMIIATDFGSFQSGYLRLYGVKNPSGAGTATISGSYAEGSIPSMREIYFYTNSFTISSSGINSYSGSISSNPGYYQGLATSSATLSVPIAMNAGESFYIIFKSTIFYKKVGMGVQYISASISGASCSDNRYPVLVCEMNSYVGSLSITLNSYPTLSTSGNIYVYTVYSNSITKSESTFSDTLNPAAITSGSAYPLVPPAASKFTAYYFKFTLPFDLPSQSCIRITFASPFSSVSVDPSFLKIKTGTFTGSITLSSSGNYLYLSGFSFFNSGIFEFSVRLMGGTNSGSPSLTVETCFDLTTCSYITSRLTGLSMDLTKYMLFSTNALSWVTFFTETYSNEKGYFSFRFRDSIASKFLKLYPPSTVFLSSYSDRMLCSFKKISTGVKYWSKSCYIESGTSYVLIAPPYTATIANTEYWEVNLLFVEANSPHFLFPNTNGQTVFNLNRDTAETSASSDAVGTANLNVYSKRLSDACVRSLVSHTSFKNVFHVKFTTTASIANTNYIQLQLPVTLKVSSTVSQTIFANDLGTGTPYNQLKPLKCTFIAGFPGTPGCYLIYGVNTAPDAPAAIQISGFTTISSGVSLELYISGITNSATANQLAFGSISVFQRTAATITPSLYYYFSFVVYTVAPTIPATVAANTPSYTSGTLVVDDAIIIPFDMSTATAANLNYFDGFLFEFNTQNYITSTITASFGKTVYNYIQQGFTSTTHLLLSTITKTSAPQALQSVQTTVTISGLKNTNVAALYSGISWTVRVLKEGIIKYVKSFNSAPPTITTGLIDSVSTTRVYGPSATAIMRSLELYEITFRMRFLFEKGGVIKIALPTGWTDLYPKCYIVSGYTGSKYTCVNNALEYIISGTDIDQAKDTTIKIRFRGRTPQTGTSPTANLAFNIYSDSAASLLKATLTTAGSHTISTTIKGIDSWPLYQYENSVKLQEKEYGSLEFNLAYATLLAKGVDYVDFQAPTGGYIWTSVKIASQYYDDLMCFWGDYAARECMFLIDGFRVYTPSDNDIAANANYLIKIMTTDRLFTEGVSTTSGFEYPVYPPTTIYSFAAQGKDGGTNTNKGTAVNNKLNIPYKRFFSTYFTMLMTNKGKESILYFYFLNSKSILNYDDPKKGNILIEFPTAYIDTTTIFADDLGIGFANGQIIDCLSPTLLDLRCKIDFGSNNADSPANIFIETKTDIPASASTDPMYKISFPKLLNPAFDKLMIKLKATNRIYNSVTGKYDTQEEFLKHDVYYITNASPSTVTAGPSGQATPAWSPNLVGQPGSIGFTISSSYTLKASYPDRFIIKTSTTGMAFEDIHYTYKGTSYNTRVDSGTLTVYQRVRWLEIEPTSDFATGTVTVQLRDFKNMPYQLTAKPSPNTGVVFQVITWETASVRQELTMGTTIVADTNVFNPKEFIPQVSPVIRQPQRYTLKFLPYNRIPKGGLVEIQIVNCPACDWNFPDTYCTVESPNLDAACDINPATRKIEIKSFNMDYDPFPPNNHVGFQMYFDTENPTTTSAPSTYYFEVRTFWDTVGRQLIDLDVNFDSSPTTRFVLQGGYILKLFYQDIYQHDYVLCGGRVGPISINFNLRQFLTYTDETTTDKIQLKFYSSFFLPTTEIEIVCYFNDPSNIGKQKVRPYDCIFDTADGGSVQVDVPEEFKTIQANKEYQLIITHRATEWGFQAVAPSGIYWWSFETTNTNDQGWFEAKIPPCPFDGSSWGFDYTTSKKAFLVEASSSEASKNVATDPTHTFINMTLKTVANDILAGDESLPQYSRFLFEFPTHNELKTAWAMDLGTNMAGTETEMGCNIRLVNLQGGPYIKCIGVKADGNAWNNTPAYIYLLNYGAIAAKKQFHVQLAEIANPDLVGTFAHMHIRVQTIQNDGTWYDIYSHWAWHIAGNYLQSPNSGSGQLSMLNAASSMTMSFSRSTSQVQLSFGRTIWSVANHGDWKMRYNMAAKFTYPFFLPARTTCENYYSITKRGPTACTPNPGSGWFTCVGIYDYDTADTTTLQIWESGSIYNPDFEYKLTPGGTNKSPYYQYIWWDGILMLYTKTYISPTRGVAYVSLHTPKATNPVSETLSYEMGIFITTRTKNFKYMYLEGPLSFPNIGGTCKIRRGFVLKDLLNPSDDIACVIIKTATKYTLEVYNFGTYLGDGWFILQLEITNPATPMWTGYWQIILYDNYNGASTDLTRIIDGNFYAGGRTWVGIKPFPNYFRVYRNTQSFESRRAVKNDYAEVHVRLIPRNILPPTAGTSSARLEIWMPLAYDIPNGGSKLCDLGQNYHKDLGGQYCEINSDRKIIVNTDTDQGLTAACNQVTVTTQGALTGDGVKLPDNPGSEDFEVYQYIGNNLIEYSKPIALAKPLPLTNLVITRTQSEVTTPSVIRISFTAIMKVSPGYDTSSGELDPLKKNPVGYIQVDFNTFDFWVNGNPGFPLDLGQATSNLPCMAIKGIIPKAGEKLKCTVYPSASRSIFNPATVKVENFDEIPEGTNVEFHLINVQNGISNYNNGKVEVSAYKILGDGTQTWIIEKTPAFIPFILYDFLVPDPATNIQPSSSITMDPNIVGEYSIMRIEFPFVKSLNTNSYFNLKFPFDFELKFQKDSDISATLDATALTTKIYAIDQDVNMIHFFYSGPTLPNALQADSPRTLVISQIRNAAHEIANWDLDFILVDPSLKRQEVFKYQAIDPPLVGKFSTLVLVLSSYYNGDVFVTYNFMLAPTYRVPLGSTITIDLPTEGPSSSRPNLNYNDIQNSNPPAYCVTYPAGYLTQANCLSSNKVTITVTKEIAEKTSIRIQLIGVKNPSFTGLTSITDYVVRIKNSNSEGINEGNIEPFSFLGKRNIDVIFMTITATSLYKSVTSNYVFSMQNTNIVPILGQIILEFPAEWGTIVPAGYKISDLKGTWTDEKLLYSEDWNTATNKLTIVPNFLWPSKSTLLVTMNGLVNPSNVDQTAIFKANTIYDLVKLDQTDPTDQSLRLKFLNLPPQIEVLGLNVSPTTEAEISTMDFVFKPKSDIPVNSQIEIMFPAAYDSLLSTYDKSIVCSSSKIPAIACTVSNGKLIVPLSTNFTGGDLLDLRVTGVMNPNYGQDLKFDFLTRQGSDILQYSASPPLGKFTPTKAPGFLNLTLLKTTSTNLQTKSSYSFCIETATAIPLGACVLFEFPNQFSLRQPSYTCSVAAGHDNVSLPYDGNDTSPGCSVQNQLRLINITGHSKAYAGGTDAKRFCYTISGIENPADSGQSGNFIASVYDPKSKEVFLKTYGTLSFPSTITYKREGLRIIVAAIPNVAKGVMSNQIAISLERSVPYTVTVIPLCPTFDFDPPAILFYSHLSSTQYFRIKPLEEAVPGQKKISWTKKEDSEVIRFSEVPDSFFNYVEVPSYKELKVNIGTSISRTALQSVSLPIQVTLSHPANSPLLFYYKTDRPNQPDFISFDPPFLTFAPGETSKSFTYTTYVGAVSGLIKFWLDDLYSSKYFLTTTMISFEILDIDHSAPDLINYYIVNMDRTYMNFRISTSESVWVYYLLSEKGTVQPPNDEIKDPSLRVSRKTKTNVIEITGKNSSEQTPITQTYIYYDTYLYFTGLEEQTDYVLYFYIEDLSGNGVTSKRFDFRTLKKHYPARFKIKLTDNVPTGTLVKAFGLVIGLPPARFGVLSAPSIFTLANITEKEVLDVLSLETTIYEFILYQNKTSNEIRPIQQVNQLEENKNILLSEVQAIDSSFDFNQNAYEILSFKQEFSFAPILLGNNEESASFNVSIKSNGTIYGIVLETTAVVPTARQLKYGLSSTNFKLDAEHHVTVNITYSPGEEDSYKSSVVKFTNLYDNTQYMAYFIAENNLPVNPDLMFDEDILSIPFQTQREIFVIPTTYDGFGSKLGGLFCALGMFVLYLITELFAY